MPAIKSVVVTLIIQKEVAVAAHDQFDIPVEALKEAQKTPYGDWELLQAATEIVR